jgi:hypothetical protein
MVIQSHQEREDDFLSSHPDVHRYQQPESASNSDPTLGKKKLGEDEHEVIEGGPICMPPICVPPAKSPPTYFPPHFHFVSSDSSNEDVEE